MGAVRRPHRTTKWVWAGRVGAVAVLAWLATYLYLVGLNRAAQIAGPIGLVVMLATLFAPYLLPTYQPAAAGPSASDSVALTGSASTVASYGVPPVAAQPTTALAQAVGGVTTVVPGQSSARSDNQALVDRDLQCEQLTAALTTGRSNVVLVHGQAGSGKSALVSWVLASRGVQETSRRELTPGSRLDAGALLRDIESDTTFGSVIRPGEDRLMRLRAAMDATDRTPATVVIDGAQHLVDSKTHNLASLELDEALGVIGAGRRRIKLILVFQELPVARTGIDWLTTAEKLSVGGLPRDYFLAYLAGLDSGGALGVSALAGTQPDMLLEVLDGVPRLAELFCAVLALPQNRWSAGGLARRLDRTPTDEREQMLARELVESLSSQQRRVVTALATYAIPVTGSYVAKLLGDELSEGRVAVLLADLLIKHVIGKIGDGYYIPVQRIQDALIHMPDGRPSLLSKAADLLSEWRRPDDHIQQIEDMELHFAELAIRIRAQQWGPAYELINSMHAFLRRWNAAGLLLKYRADIAGQLQVSFREMVNYNALGCIYKALGRYVDAQEAFEKALRHASSTTWPHGRRKIFINLANLRWERGDAVTAEENYSKALAMAKEHDDALDGMAAEAGLADCFRRWGDYQAAIGYGKRALCVARAEGSSWAVGIAVKLARWHSELGHPEEASRLIDVAEEAAAEHPDPGLRVQCRDGRADLQLDAGEVGKASETARRALIEAQQLDDSVTMLQARTTMAMAYLGLGEISAARDEIELAAPYRREGRSLVVLALQALIAFRFDPDGRARQLFADLEREAVGRREGDEQDFAAWDFEGLAICGRLVGQAGPLDAAVAAFRRARNQVPAPPALDARLRFWLSILQAKATPGQMEPVVAAATGAGASAGRP